MKTLPKEVDAGAYARFATIEHVADYRAQRLQCDTLIEIGCGIGMQTRAFAKTCNKVIAIDVDKHKLSLAKKNVKSKNVTFMRGDGVALLKECKGNIVFCDPERAAEEKSRTIRTILPNPVAVYETAKAKNMDLAIELPPHLQNIPFPCEREYIGYRGKLNRMTAYTGKLATAATSAVMLPGRQRIQGNSTPPQQGRVTTWLCELNPAVVKAGLTRKFGETVTDGKAVYACTKVTGAFVTNTYKIIKSAETIQEATKILQHYGFGKVLLRLRLPPEKYWHVRKQIEQHLTGDKQAILLKINQILYLAQK